jgi:hypothetical protein
MNQILDIIQLYKTGSVSPGSTTPGTGSIFTSGSVPDLYFKNNSGTIFKLNDSGSYVKFYEWTGSAGSTVTATWIKPSNAKYIKIAAVGGGAGGGGGARNAGINNVSGGGGGAGGQTSIIFYTSDRIPTGQYTVTVGSGGTGGGGAAANGSNGTAGSSGGTTSLVSGSVTLIQTTSVTGGSGGSAAGTGANGGNPTVPAGVLPYGPFRIQGYAGARAISGGTTGLPSVINTISLPAGIVDVYHARQLRLCGGGGAGGGITQTGNITRAGGSGSGIELENGTVFTSGGGGLAGVGPGAGGNGSDGVPNIVSMASLFSFSGSAVITSSYGFGTAGNGGGSNDIAETVTGGNGGDGISFGSGGGGGGGAWDQPAGSGGDGGPGYLAILEFY